MSITEAVVEGRATTGVRSARSTQGYIFDFELTSSQNFLTVDKNLTAATFSFLTLNRVTKHSLRSWAPKQLILIHPTSEENLVGSSLDSRKWRPGVAPLDPLQSTKSPCRI